MTVWVDLRAEIAEEFEALVSEQYQEVHTALHERAEYARQYHRRWVDANRPKVRAIKRRYELAMRIPIPAIRACEWSHCGLPIPDGSTVKRRFCKKKCATAFDNHARKMIADKSPLRSEQSKRMARN